MQSHSTRTHYACAHGVRPLCARRLAEWRDLTEAQVVDVAAGAVVTRDISRIGALLDQCLMRPAGTAPAELAAVCRACLEPDPRKHYSNVDTATEAVP